VVEQEASGVTNTCKYRRRGKVCRRKAVTTLVSYGVKFGGDTHEKAVSVMQDMSIRQAYSYCSHCADLIAKRCLRVSFMTNAEVTHYWEERKRLEL
jgi:hypothetical protein